MKVPKEFKTFCRKCGKHMIHSVTLYKPGKVRTGALGTRRHAEDKKGYGGQKFPKLADTAKTTKKQTLKWKCKECGFERMRHGIRLKKLEIVA